MEKKKEDMSFEEYFDDLSLHYAEYEAEMEEYFESDGWKSYEASELIYMVIFDLKSLKKAKLFSRSQYRIIKTKSIEDLKKIIREEFKVKKSLIVWKFITSSYRYLLDWMNIKYYDNLYVCCDEYDIVGKNIKKVCGRKSYKKWYRWTVRHNK